MKFYKIILFSSLILSIYSSSICSLQDQIIASSAKDCQKYEPEEGASYCCFLKGTGENGKSVGTCTSLTKEEYKDMDGTISSYEEEGASVDKLDCKSIYLELSILTFILLLL